MPEHWEIKQKQEHWQRCDKLAKWLGWRNVQKLIPFDNETIKQALAEGDEYLNKWGNTPWDRAHGNPPGKKLALDWMKRPEIVDAPKICQCCKQTLPPPDRTAGMWGLVRAAIQRDKDAGREPLVTGWSLSDTICVLKHVAREVANAKQAD